MASCINVDDIHEESVSLPITYEVGGVETKATLVKTENLAEQFPIMEVKAVRNNEVQFTEYMNLKKSPIYDPSTIRYWDGGEYTFFSFPTTSNFKEIKTISPTYTNDSMSFNFTVGQDSKSTYDLVVACTKKSSGTVSLDYKHVFAGIEVYYKELKYGHKITSIKVKNVNLTGRCTASTSSVAWSNLSNKGDIVDSDVVYATHNNTELNKDGSKFMVIPGQSAQIEVVIDGKVVKSTVVSNLVAGEMYKYTITDDLELTKKEGSYCSATIEGDVLKVEAYVTGEYTTTTTTSSKPMDFILVLDYSSSMGDSYRDSKLSSYNKASVTTHTYNDWKNNKTKFKATLNGVQYTVQCTDTEFSGENLSGSSNVKNTHFAYIEANSKRYYITLDGGLYESTNKNPTFGNPPVSVDGVIVPPVTGGSVPLWGEVTYSNTQVKTRIVALQAAVSKFVDTVEKDARDNNVDHRISIVSFKNPKFPYYMWGKAAERERYLNPSYKEYLHQCYFNDSFSSSALTSDKDASGILYPFRSITTTNVPASIKGALSLDEMTICCTAIDYGMYFASVLVGKKRANTDACVIVFTDGKPTYGSIPVSSDSHSVIPGYGTSVRKDSDVADGAKKFAKACKDAGATVWSVGVFSGSDKPSGTFMTDIATDANHYKDVSSSSLSEVFATIATESTKGEADIDVHTDAFIQVHFSNAVNVSSATYVGGYTLTQSSYNESTKAITFGTNHGGLSGINVKTNTSTGVITISGFDYGKYFCGKGANGKGMKLVLEFKLDKNTDLTGTGSNKVLVYPSGLYKDADTPLYLVDSPDINL